MKYKTTLRNPLYSTNIIEKKYIEELNVTMCKRRNNKWYVNNCMKLAVDRESRVPTWLKVTDEYTDEQLIKEYKKFTKQKCSENFKINKWFVGMMRKNLIEFTNSKDRFQQKYNTSVEEYARRINVPEWRVLDNFENNLPLDHYNLTKYRYKDNSQRGKFFEQFGMTQQKAAELENITKEAIRKRWVKDPSHSNVFRKQKKVA